MQSTRIATTTEGEFNSFPVRTWTVVIIMYEEHNNEVYKYRNGNVLWTKFWSSAV